MKEIHRNIDIHKLFERKNCRHSFDAQFIEFKQSFVIRSHNIYPILTSLYIRNKECEKDTHQSIIDLSSDLKFKYNHILRYIIYYNVGLQTENMVRYFNKDCY